MKLFSFALALALISFALGFELKISDQDDYRQACSGMWGGDKAYIKGVRGFSVSRNENYGPS